MALAKDAHNASRKHNDRFSKNNTTSAAACFVFRAVEERSGGGSKQGRNYPSAEDGEVTGKKRDWASVIDSVENSFLKRVASSPDALGGGPVSQPTCSHFVLKGEYDNDEARS